MLRTVKTTLTIPQIKPKCTCWKSNKKLRKYTPVSDCPKHKN